MGTFEFRWTHPASEVYVTGTFDDWSKSEKLVKQGDVFAKNVTLSDASISDKIYYKFVVDGNWVIDHTARQENDASGNLNNVLTIDRINKHTPATAGIMSGVTPESTTAALAKDVPLERHARSGSTDLPGTFPETPAAVERDEVSVNPLPAADGAVNPITLAPGQKVPDPASFTSNTLTSGVHDDPELVAADRKRNEATGVVGVAPLPAFPGGVNPIQLAPGAPVPDSSTFSGAGLGNTGPTIQSVGPGSTTAQLAAAVPLESAKVPEVVKASQEKAGVSPEASAIPAEVREKSAMEKELLQEVPTAPTTAEGTGSDAGSKTKSSSAGGISTAAAGAAAGAAATVGATAAAALSRSGVKDKLPESVQKSIDEMNVKSVPTAKDTPAVVKESIAKSGQSPEAAANEEAVLEKKAVERELLSEITPDHSTGQSAPKVAAHDTTTSQATPAVVQHSIAQSGQSPEAAANTEAVLEKKAMEKELLSGAQKQDSSAQQTSQQTAPTVTTGLDSVKTDAVSSAPPSTPSKTAATTDATTGTPASGTSKATASPASTAATDKKKKRMSLLTKIKAKITDKLDKH